jgi:histidinol-phosphate aminotransferase
MTISELARPEIRALQSYKVAASPDGAIRLNANEAPLAIGNGAAQDLNRYPALRPTALTASMAGYFGVTADNVLVTRGSSEGIDLLVRTFCRAGRDAVLLAPPTFALYEVYASVQGARTIKVPLRTDRDFALDTPALLSACDERTKLIFLCSPNNPVGTVIPREEILRIVEARAGKSVVIVDEAYVEYSRTDSLAPLVPGFDNLVVLRTLSKALALAGARCGAVVAPAALIGLLDGVLAPYAVASPVIRSVELALSDSQLTEAQALVAEIVAERERLRAELAACKAVQQIWPSEANFLLIRFRDLPAVERCLGHAQIAIRTFADDSSLRDCARITVASANDNDRLVQAIRGLD